MKYFVKAGLFFCIIFFVGNFCNAQDTVYARRTINKLCSEKFAGRGYVNDGDKKAAEFIADEFKRLDVSKTGADYFQEFYFGVNTFPSKMEVKINNQQLVAGKEFIIHPASSSSTSKYIAVILKKYEGIKSLMNASHCCFIVYKDSLSSNEYSKLQSDLYSEEIKSGAFVFVEQKKLTWSVSTSHFEVPAITILQEHVPKEGEKIFLNIKSCFVTRHNTQNVVGVIPSGIKTDSTIVFTAHYDHLGKMGRHTCFPGANDNASGVSMLLNLAKHYSINRQQLKYNIMFIAFAGEEAGLIGSNFYTENPIFPLNKIKFLINMDLMGTGDDGMMVVNATEYKEQFELLKKINEQKNYLVKIGERGKAKNSDHYYFSEKGVPCFFFYTMGGITAYHDVYDVSATLPLTDYADVFRLITDFVSQL